jgi:flagellar biosynthesis/type III secretory pathway protein FliH
MNKSKKNIKQKMKLFHFKDGKPYLSLKKDAILTPTIIFIIVSAALIPSMIGLGYWLGGRSGNTDNYDQGYKDGYNKGHKDGNDTGYINGFNNGFDEGNLTGYDQGFILGNKTGYDQGYNQGNQTGYDQGYDNGFLNGNQTGYDQGYIEGYNKGYDKGYSDGFDIGYNEGYDDGYFDGYNEGYDDGYFDGFEDGKNYSVSAVKVNMNFTNTANIITNYTMLWQDTYSNFTSLNGSYYTCQVGTLYSFPFEITNGSVLNNLSFFIKTGIGPAYTDIEINMLENDTNYILNSFTVSIAPNWVDWLNISLPLFIDNATYRFQFKPKNEVFEIGLANLNTTRLNDSLTELECTPAFNNTYTLYTENADESYPFDLGQFMLTLVGVKPEDAQLLAAEKFDLHIIGRQDVNHGMFGSWFNITIDTNLTLFMVLRKAEVYQRINY